MNNRYKKDDEQSRQRRHRYYNHPEKLTAQLQQMKIAIQYMHLVLVFNQGYQG